MAKIQNKAKRVLAVAIALMMVLGACFTGIVTASAESLATGVANVATTTTDFATTKGQYSLVSDIEGGGVTYTTGAAYNTKEGVGATQNGTLSPYVHNVSGGAISAGTVATLQFNNFEYGATTDNVAGKFMVALASKIGSNTGNYWRLASGVAAIEFDTVAGTISLISGTAIGSDPTIVCTIATNDALKYENFTGKAFTLAISGTAEGGIAVSVVVDDTTISGTVSAADWTSIANRPTNDVFFAISSAMRKNGSIAMSLEYYGFTTQKAPFAAGLADGLNKASAALAGMPSVAGNRTYLDIAGGGVSIIFTQSGSYYPYVMNSNVGAFRGNNYRLQFANYVSTATNAELFGYRQFAIGFVQTCTAGDNQRKFFKKASGIRFDTVNGKIDLIEGNNATDNVLSKYDVITDEALLYDNFTGHAFTVDFYNTSVSIDVVVTIADYDENGDKVLKGSIPADVYSALTYPLTGANGYFSVSGIEHALGANPWSIDFYGWKAIAPAYAEGLDNYVSIADRFPGIGEGTYSGEVQYIPVRWGMISDIATGGIYMNYNQNAGYHPYVPNINFGGYGSGAKLQFSNFVDNTADGVLGKGHFMLTLTNAPGAATQPYKLKANTFALDFDTNAGKLQLVQGTTAGMTDYAVLQEIIVNDALLYANFTGKPFSIQMMSNVDGDVDVILNIDGTDYKGVLDVSLFETVQDEAIAVCPPTASTMYIGLGSGLNDGSGGTKFAVNFYGYNNPVEPEYIAEAKNSVETLVTSANNVYTRSASYITDLEGGGVHYQAGGHFPFQLDQGMDRWPGNGFKLQFANYSEMSSNADLVGYRQFVVFFNYGLNNNANLGQYWKGGNIGLNIDAVEGQLELVKSDQATLAHAQKYVQKVLIEDDMFLYSNLTGKPFSYEVLPTGANDAAIINITVGSQKRTCVISYDEFVSVPEGFTTTTSFYPTNVKHAVSQCNVSFSALLHDGTTAAVDFYGYTKYTGGNLGVGSNNAISFQATSVPVSVTTEEEQTMTIEVKADAPITGIVAADGIEIATVIDGNTALVDVLTAVAGTDVKLFDVQFVTGEETIYTVEANVVADDEGNKPSIRGAKGGVIVAENTPDVFDYKYQATEGPYQIGTLGFMTTTAALSASVGDNFIAVEFGTVFFTKKLLGEQELVIGTKAANGGTAQAITVSKMLSSNEELPEQFVAILKDKASNTSGVVSDSYANTTFVARSFVTFMDADTGAVFTVYGVEAEKKLADIQ